MQDITFPTIAALIALQIALAANVSRIRGQTNTLIGSGTDPADPLYKARVAHSNASEFIPAMAILILGLHLQGASMAWQIAGACTFLARVIHAAGILVPERLDKPNPFRVAGAAGSYGLGLALAGRLFLSGL
jgi:uncharacterized membrane protein YecN with MAPEG domain